MNDRSLIKNKVAQIPTLLREFNIDCWISFVRESQFMGDPILDYILGADVTWYSAFIFTVAGKAHAVVGQYDVQTVKDVAVYGSVDGYVTDFGKPFLERLQQINPRKIAVNYSEDSEIADGLTHGMYLYLKRLLKTIGYDDRLISAEPIVSALRERKIAQELDRIKSAITATEEIFVDVRKFIKVGTTEKKIASIMRNMVRQRNLDFAWNEEICPSVFTGPDTAGAHYTPTDLKLEPGHLLSMDFGVKVSGYCSDLQRIHYILDKGEIEPPASVQRGFNTLIKAVKEARKLIRPGSRGEIVDRTAREIITSQGYEEFPAGLGHQVGRFAHDGTALLGPLWEKYGSKPKQLLREGMVFTIEPRLEVPGHGIMTVEEMVVINKTGAEYISIPQKELIIIGNSNLNSS